MLKFEVIPVTQFAQNCSLIWCDETHQAALIDPGGEADKLLAAIAKRGLTLTHILLTHGHLDHVGAAAELREKTGVTITGPHKEDAFWLDMLPQQSQMFGFAHTPAFTPDRWLEQGDKVQLGQCELEVYFCPGHTRAISCCSANPSGSPGLAMCCLPAASAVPTSPVGITPL